MPNTISNKVAIVILSDPKASTDEALGRVFNALAVSYDYDQAGSDVRVQFQGAGMALVRENPVPGTTGIAGMRALIADGYHVITF